MKGFSLDFCNTHNHSTGSLLDGQTKVEDIPRLAYEMGQSSVALTDHGTLGQSLKFWEASKECGVKGIQGWEAYVTPDKFVKDKDAPIWHLIMLAQNQQGLHNLFALSKIGWVDGFYRKPRIDYKDLAAYSEGIIVLSGCMAGETARAIERGDMDEAKAALSRYRDIFSDRFYVELQPGNTVELNSTLANLADDLSLKKVVSVDSHYDVCGSKANQELLLIMQQVSGFKKSDKDYAASVEYEARKKGLMERLNTLWPNRGLRFDEHDLHMMSGEEVKERMSLQGFDSSDLISTSLEIAERCEQIEFSLGQSYLPKLLKSVDSDEYLSALAMDGLEELGLNKEPYISRLKHELDVVTAKNFSDYFLIVWDVVNEAKRRGVYVGTGRGSAAGALLCYVLRITNIDPIKYDLSFERFLDYEREDYPDVDLDFMHSRRDEMKSYLEERYGERLSLCTYGEFQAKGLIRSISRALSIPLSEVNEACKSFETLDEYETSPGTAKFRAAYPEIIGYARKLEGTISQTGMHASAVVIANRPMSDIVPVESRTDPEDKKKRVPVSAFDMKDAEKVGLIKFDFLGLSSLTVVKDTVELIKERHGVDIDWENLDPVDENVFSMLDSGHSIGVFQMEQSSYKRLLGKMKINNFADMYISNALVRPGAAETVAKDYIARQKNPKLVDYPHESVKDVLEKTLGLYIFQEQIMTLSMRLGDFSVGEANRLRKIIGKKMDVSEFKPYFDKWMKNASQKIGEKAAKKMWSDFEHHAKYSFNSAHSVAYSYLSYATAYLKHYYPVEFIYSLVKNEKAPNKIMSYLMEASRLGISIIPPSVQDSDISMKVVDVDGEGCLMFGLSDIKNVGLSACKEILTKRPFSSYGDFSERVEKRACNAKVVASLVAVNAFDGIPDSPKDESFEMNFGEYLNYPVELGLMDDMGILSSNAEDYSESSVDSIVIRGVVKTVKRTDRYVRIEVEDMTGSVSCFGDRMNDLSEGESVVCLITDKTMVGYARLAGLKERKASGRLDFFEKLLFGQAFDEYADLKKVGVGGLQSKKSLVAPISINEITTKAGKKMGFVYLTDGSDVEKVTIFPNVWSALSGVLVRGEAVCVMLKPIDNGRTLYAKDVISVKDLRDQIASKFK